MKKAFFALFAGILAYQILLPPVVGMADSGDFGKVAGIFSLGAPSEAEFKHLSLTYTFAPQYRQWAGFLSFEQAIAGFGVLVNGLIGKDGRFDIRVMGTLHAVIYLALWYLAAPLVPRGKKAAWVAAALALLLFSDVFYAAMFNTFYMDTAALLGVFATGIGFLRAANGIALRGSRWLALAGALVLVLSKTQHALVGICLIAGLGLPLVRRRMGLGSAGAAFAGGLLLLAMAASFVIVPGYYRVMGSYNVIFYEILPHSKDVGADLADLHLDDSYRPYIGTHSFDPASGMQHREFIEAFSKRTSNVGLLGYYASHPAITLRVLKNALGQAGRQRAAMGNFDASSGLPDYAESSAFSLWSGAKRSLFEGKGGRYLWASFALFALCGFAVIRDAKQGTGIAGTGLLAGLLAAVALVEMLASGLADVLDVTRHYYLFGALWDCLLMLLVLSAIGRAQRD